jgi:hypothetical protein
MNDQLDKYLDGVFSQYEDENTIRELKEEIKDRSSGKMERSETTRVR